MNNNANNQQFFRTSDIWLTGFLLAIGEKYISIDRVVDQGRRKVYFLFLQEAEERAHDFFNGEMISAVKYRNYVENVKNILYDFK